MSGKQHGKGAYVTASGHKKEGEWREGKPVRKHKKKPEAFMALQ